MLTEVDSTRRARIVIGGHYPSPDFSPAFPFVAVVIPELRLTDKSLADATNLPFLPVVEGPA